MLIVNQLLKEFPSFYGTQRFIIAITTARKYAKQCLKIHYCTDVKL
jgi:hypothetical protein